MLVLVTSSKHDAINAHLPLTHSGSVENFFESDFTTADVKTRNVTLAAGVLFEPMTSRDHVTQQQQQHSGIEHNTHLPPSHAPVQHAALTSHTRRNNERNTKKAMFASSSDIYRMLEERRHNPLVYHAQSPYRHFAESSL